MVSSRVVKKDKTVPSKALGDMIGRAIQRMEEHEIIEARGKRANDSFEKDAADDNEKAGNAIAEDTTGEAPRETGPQKAARTVKEEMTADDEVTTNFVDPQSKIVSDMESMPLDSIVTNYTEHISEYLPSKESLNVNAARSRCSVVLLKVDENEHYIPRETSRDADIEDYLQNTVEEAALLIGPDILEDVTYRVALRTPTMGDDGSVRKFRHTEMRQYFKDEEMSEGSGSYTTSEYSSDEDQNSLGGFDSLRSVMDIHNKQLTDKYCKNEGSQKEDNFEDGGHCENRDDDEKDDEYTTQGGSLISIFSKNILLDCEQTAHDPQQLKGQLNDTIDQPNTDTTAANNTDTLYTLEQKTKRDERNNPKQESTNRSEDKVGDISMKVPKDNSTITPTLTTTATMTSSSISNTNEDEPSAMKPESSPAPTTTKPKKTLFGSIKRSLKQKKKSILSSKLRNHNNSKKNNNNNNNRKGSKATTMEATGSEKEEIKTATAIPMDATRITKTSNAAREAKQKRPNENSVGGKSSTDKKVCGKVRMTPNTSGDEEFSIPIKTKLRARGTRVVDVAAADDARGEGVSSGIAIVDRREEEDVRDIVEAETNDPATLMFCGCF